MKRRGKVIHVDFNKERRKPPAHLGGGPRFVVGVFVAALVAVVVLMALASPSMVTSAFFAPTAIVVAVLAALGARRVMARAQVDMLHKAMMEKQKEDDEGPGGRTLH